MQAYYFGYLGHAWLYTTKMIVSTCRRLRCLSACQKYTSSFSSFLRYYILKNPTIWLADSILTHNSRTRILPDMRLVVKSNNIKKIKKPLFWGHFGPFLQKFVQKRIFLKKRALSVFTYSNYLPLSQKNQKITLSQRRTDRRTGRQLGRWTDRQQWFNGTLHRIGVQKERIFEAKHVFHANNWKKKKFVENDHSF